MNTFTNRLRSGVVGLALISTWVAAPTYAQADGDTTPKAKASKQENIGVVTGLAVGAAAGGPVGAILGAAAGGWLGDRYHKKAVANESLEANLGQSESQRTVLAQDVTTLNASLVEARQKSDQLDLALKKTDELQTDVSFRTNDSSVNPQALAPLQKIGALAASMPDVKVRVAGFADSRGSDEVNDALSRHRAEAVAEVLAQAGVPKDRMIVEGHGKSESTAMDGDLDGYALDRKVTVRLERTGGGQEVARNE
ncbi:MAG TPA: OmpA family protein [Steroidobacteraceae bacterium]|nr:OmpA family protein [Steroidobacteraceae bacterium]